jgi:aminopeptidase N
MPSLSRAEAAQRADLLRVVEYDIDLDVTAEAGFGSVTTIRFECTEPGASTFVELRPAELLAATLNGAPVDPGTLADNRLPLPDLAASNELTVRATMAYSHTGEGLHRFVDPEDGGTYLYAQAFLDDAQRVFACFDQPDLKAPVSMRVTAPVDWEVAGNGAETLVGPGRWELARTEPISTYLVTLLAGAYHVRRDEHDGIPLATYCRRALAPHLDKDSDEIFELTKGFLDRFHQLFGVRYPFGKYGQAFVPEFNAGAMENPGLVTFRDEMLYRSAVTDVEREQRASTIAHEMAHMWFGDLVTMRWWDDLWLNESFAEYMGYRVTAEASRFRNAWTGFAVARKSWGYIADQRPSTHPVAPESVVDTAHALLNFDGISYAKGAAVLRQLVAWLGDDVFLAGLSGYFRAHAFDNATLADLLDALGRAAGRDLGAWAEVWLRRPQVNTLRAEVTFGPANDFDTVHIVQSAPAAAPTLRPHRVGIGVYGHGERRHQFLVDLDPADPGGRTAVPALTGVTAGDLLLVNDGDLTYAKVRFDPTSLAGLVETLPRLRDPLARAVVWASTMDSVRDAELPVETFLTLLEAGLPLERELSLVRDLTRFAASRAIDAPFAHTGVVARFVPPALVPATDARVAAACHALLAAAPSGSGLALAAARGYIATAQPDPLREWLTRGAPAGLDLDVELRWAVFARLAALGATNAVEIAAAADQDRTASGAVHAARCQASLPDPGAKERAWQTMVGDSTASNRLVGAAADGFWQPGRENESYVERYFAEMPDVATRRSPAMMAHIGASAYPRYAASPDTIDLAVALLERPDLHPVLRRTVVDCTDELSRALAARRLAGPS